MDPSIMVRNPSFWVRNRLIFKPKFRISILAQLRKTYHPILKNFSSPLNFSTPPLKMVDQLLFSGNVAFSTFLSKAHLATKLWRCDTLLVYEITLRPISHVFISWLLILKFRGISNCSEITEKKCPQKQADMKNRKRKVKFGHLEKVRL